MERIGFAGGGAGWAQLSVGNVGPPRLWKRISLAVRGPGRVWLKGLFMGQQLHWNSSAEESD